MALALIWEIYFQTLVFNSQVPEGEEEVDKEEVKEHILLHLEDQVVQEEEDLEEEVDFVFKCDIF